MCFKHKIYFEHLYAIFGFVSISNWNISILLERSQIPFFIALRNYPFPHFALVTQNENISDFNLLAYDVYLLTYLLTPWSRAFLEKQTGSQLVKKFPAFKEPEDSSPHSQVHTACSYPELARSSPYPQIPLPLDPSSYYPSIYTWIFQVVSFPQLTPSKPCIGLSSPSYPLRVPPILSFSIFITRKILDEEYRSLSSSLCRFFHSPVTSSLLGPNILLNALFSITFTLRSFLSVSDQVSHSYKTTGKTMTYGVRT